MSAVDESLNKSNQTTPKDCCAICGCKMGDDDYRPTEKGLACTDCYFDELSAVIDEHPIGRPGR